MELYASTKHSASKIMFMWCFIHYYPVFKEKGKNNIHSAAQYTFMDSFPFVKEVC